jgi:hypothetical protein
MRGTYLEENSSTLSSGTNVQFYFTKNALNAWTDFAYFQCVAIACRCLVNMTILAAKIGSPNREIYFLEKLVEWFLLN